MFKIFKQGRVLRIQEVDGSPVGIPTVLKFPNGTLTDNGDGTFTYTAAAAGAHTHTASEITDFTEAVQDVLGALLGDSTTIDVTYDDSANTFTVTVIRASAAEINTGTDANKAVTPDALAGSNFGIRYLQVAVFDYTTDMATGDGKAYVTVPAAYAGMNLVAVHGRVITAGTTSTCLVQIHNLTQTADMLSTRLSIDSAETGSDTAAAAAVIDGNNDDVAANDLLRIDVDQVHTTAAKGLILTMGFQLP